MPISERPHAAVDVVLAEARADRALLHDVERRRERAGPQQQRQLAGLAGQQPGDLEIAAEHAADGRDADDLLLRALGAGAHAVAGLALATRFFSMNTTAIGRPRFSRVVRSISEAPRASSLTYTAGWPSLNPELASASCSPETMMSRFSSTGWPSRVLYSLEPSGARLVRSASAAEFWSSTSRNSSVAVAPSTRSASFGSCTPGSCTTMRSSPWRATMGSVTPSSSTRLRSVVMFCWIAKSWRCLMFSGRTVTLTVPPSPSASVSMIRFGSRLRSSDATRGTSALERSMICTVSEPLLCMPLNGMRSSRSMVR